MKLTLLTLALLTGACQTAGPSQQTSMSPAPAALEASTNRNSAIEAPTARLPRRVHLDRWEHAARSWARDRS